jgi:hypothetical protein
MQPFSIIESARLSVTTEQQSQTDSVSQGKRQQAMFAVRQENHLAALDLSRLSTASPKAFERYRFDFSENSRTSARVVWQGSARFAGAGEYQSNFSLSMSISIRGEVRFSNGTEIAAGMFYGEDFRYDSNGLLTMLEDLIGRMGSQDRTEIDLRGELDERALDLLQRLGLIDGEGKSTPLLQALSDFAGLDRFYSGQPVILPSGNRYGTLNQNMLAWQRWTRSVSITGHANLGSSNTSVKQLPVEQRATETTGGNSISNVQAGGDVIIDDRDTVNIHIHGAPATEMVEGPVEE